MKSKKKEVIMLTELIMDSFFLHHFLQILLVLFHYLSCFLSSFLLFIPHFTQPIIFWLFQNVWYVYILLIIFSAFVHMRIIGFLCLWNFWKTSSSDHWIILVKSRLLWVSPSWTLNQMIIRQRFLNYLFVFLIFNLFVFLICEIFFTNNFRI